MVCSFFIIEIHIINVTVCQMYQPSIYHGLSSSKKNLGYVFCRVVVVVEMFHFFKTRQPFLAAELAAAKMPSATLLLTLLDWDHMKEVLEAEQTQRLLSRSASICWGQLLHEFEDWWYDGFFVLAKFIFISHSHGVLQHQIGLYS